MNTKIGTTLATVTMRLMIAASLTPRRIRKQNIHTPTDEARTAITVSPARVRETVRSWWS